MPGYENCKILVGTPLCKLLAAIQLFVAPGISCIGGAAGMDELFAKAWFVSLNVCNNKTINAGANKQKFTRFTARELISLQAGGR